MDQPDWNGLVLDPAVLREPSAGPGRIIVWLPGERYGGFQHWERIASVAHAETVETAGLRAVAATTLTARQKLAGAWFGKLLSGGPSAAGGRALMVPNGATAEATGDRVEGPVLVWSNDAAPLDEARLQVAWPRARRYRRLGPNVFLVEGAAANEAAPDASRETSPGPAPAPDQDPAIGPGPAPASPQDGSPRPAAEAWLADARSRGDRVQEVAALTDLAIIVLTEGNAPAAIALFQQALPLARQLGDAGRENDILGNLGMAHLHARRPALAGPLLEHALAHARASGDRLSEKLALERLGLAASSIGASEQALTFFEQASALAREVGDHYQEATLLWYQAIQLANLNRREEAIKRGRNAVELLRRFGHPHAAVYEEHLQKFRAEGQDAALGPGPAPGAPPSSSGTASTNGPGLLKMALSATKAMARFAGSGFKTASPEVQRKRLEICSRCEHHTGLRCKICGCFTSAKSRLLHEACPIGKWPE